MKKYPFFIIALFVLSFISCEPPYCNCPDRYLPEFQVYENSGDIYDGRGAIFMSDSNISADKPILIETMLTVGEVWNTGLYLGLPENVDSLFLAKLDTNTSPGMYTEPKDVEVWFYEKPLIFVQYQYYQETYMYLGDLEYRMIDENKIHKIFYWYFSKNAKIKYFNYNSETETYECGYNIDAKKGWNKVYFYKNITNGRTCYTTTLSRVPDGLKWFFTPVAEEN